MPPATEGTVITNPIINAYENEEVSKITPLIMILNALVEAGHDGGARPHSHVQNPQHCAWPHSNLRCGGMLRLGIRAASIEQQAITCNDYG